MTSLFTWKRAAHLSWTIAAALLITAYGALLRLDAFTGKYGTLAHPAWARLATYDVAPIARRLRPSSIAWGPDEHPYVGGDPITYLKFGRAMTSFYQAHVREPVFLALTRFGLWALDGQDAGVSLASAIGGVALIFATFLLGTAVASPAVGLAAAAMMAVDFDAITWAVDGWRDDTFTAAVLLAAWALVRFRERPNFRYAVLTGLTGVVACLTRITALSFIVPALVWIVLAGDGRRERARQAALAFGILLVVVGPYLISCALATGDPFIAINYHTTYYRFAEGLPIGQPMSAGAYLRQKFAQHPVSTIDAGAVGLFVWPFITKWNGLSSWTPWLTTIGWWSALAGLAIWPFSPKGRLLIVILIASLLPYAFTWNVGGGGEWRFTMHVYPLYAIAAAQAWALLLSPWWRTAPRVLVWRAALVTAAGCAGTIAYIGLPWFVAREAIANGEALNVQTGDRDWVFYRSGWSEPHQDGIVTARVSQDARTTVHFPLPSRKAFEIVLRVDPVAPERQERLTVLFNRQLIGTLRLSWDPARIGSYRLSLPVAWVRKGDNEITLVPDTLVPAGSAGPRFSWIDSGSPIGVRFWYLRVLD